MLGAIAGDVIGSIYEWNNIRTTEFPLFSEGCRFTDDTVLTVAVAECILKGSDYVDAFHSYYSRYPHAGFGGSFRNWAGSKRREPYNSFGNGSAMRVSPVGYAFGTMPDVLREAERSAAVTHNHPEGIKGAQAVASAIFMARTGSSKDEIRAFMERSFRYDLSATLDDIRPLYRFDVSCQGSVPQAIRAFLESDGYEDAVRKAISLGGDSDTLACMAGGIAAAFYGGVPEPVREKALGILDEPLRAVAMEFCECYGVS
ncbi:MAG: ADP-ribosylglycohydrolase family protein [Armatimonadota bacterium]|nr:ADP-ribosylglycohydrolase family protein [Armatimonadota bacterium]